VAASGGWPMRRRWPGTGRGGAGQLVDEDAADRASKEVALAVCAHETWR
jgi:hypothetical protein